MFIEVKFKFADKLKNIAIGVIIASILNIGLNFIFIPLYGYQWAAITTLVAYLFLLLYFYLQDDAGFFRSREYMISIGLLILLLILQIALDQMIKRFYDLTFSQTMIEAFLFIVVYLLLFGKKILKLKIPV